jgi:hypothetical protein
LKATKADSIRTTRRVGAFAVLALRAIDKIRRGEWTGPEAAAHFERVARTDRLRETGHYAPKLVDILITRVRGPQGPGAPRSQEIQDHASSRVRRQPTPALAPAGQVAEQEGPELTMARATTPKGSKPHESKWTVSSTVIQAALD